MPLDLPSGTRCFVDANIFYLHLVTTPDLSDPCTQFVDRISRGDVLAFVSVHVLADTVHKVMLTEAALRFDRPRAALVSWLASHPDAARQLTWGPEAMEDLLQLPLRVLQASMEDLHAAVRLSTTHGLLTNDSLILAQMRRHDLSHLVTNDADFLRVPDLRVWMPR